LAIKVIPFARRFLVNSNDKEDCIALRMFDRDSSLIEVSFPFHEDTPNFFLSISEALDLKNAIDQLIDLKMLEKPREEK